MAALSNQQPSEERAASGEPAPMQGVSLTQDALQHDNGEGLPTTQEMYEMAGLAWPPNSQEGLAAKGFSRTEDAAESDTETESQGIPPLLFGDILQDRKQCYLYNNDHGSKHAGTDGEIEAGAGPGLKVEAAVRGGDIFTPSEVMRDAIDKQIPEPWVRLSCGIAYE